MRVDGIGGTAGERVNGYSIDMDRYVYRCIHIDRYMYVYMYIDR